MTIDFTKLAALADKAVSTGADMTVAKTGGGDYTPPPAGPCGLRLVGYIEIGKHDKTFKGVAKEQNRVQLVFELSGKNHPVVEKDGKKIATRITIEENLSLNEKAGFFKLFNRMNHEGKAKHMVALLGQDFAGEVVHSTYKRKDGTEGIGVSLRNKDGYTVFPPFYDEVIDGEATGKKLRRNIPAPVSELRYFLWDHADMDQWNGLFIEGEYEARTDKDGKVVSPARSKNVFQNKIKLAKNFKGSPVHTMLAANGGNLDIPDAEVPGDDEADEAQAPAAPVATVPVGAAADDALAGVV